MTYCLENWTNIQENQVDDIVALIFCFIDISIYRETVDIHLIVCVQI